MKLRPGDRNSSSPMFTITLETEMFPCYPCHQRNAALIPEMFFREGVSKHGRTCSQSPYFSDRDLKTRVPAFHFPTLRSQMAVRNRREEGKTLTPSALMEKIQTRPK